MARMSRPEGKTSNPATKFLEWKSDERCFAYYDKEKGENVKVQVPVKFVFIEHYHTVKGWHNKSESGITSNEVFSIGSEPLTVRAFKGGELAKGFYKDIKQKIVDEGAVYHRSIYAMDWNGELVNISLKGAAVQAYSEFFKDKRKEIEGSFWFGVEDVLAGKKGAVKYHTPVFSIIAPTTAKEEREVAKCVAELEEYMAEYKKSAKPTTEGDEDLPF
jgi:hypothetical protein